MSWQERSQRLWEAGMGCLVESDERRKENLQACLKLEGTGKMFIKELSWWVFGVL